MSSVYLDVDASAAFGHACCTSGKSAVDLAGEARAALAAGLLDTSAADQIENLGGLLDVLSRSIDEITVAMQSADSLALFGLAGAATGYLAQLEAMLVNVAAGVPAVVPQDAPIDLLGSDPDQLVEMWPDLSEEQREAIAVALTAQQTELPDQKELSVLVDAWKDSLSSEDLEWFYTEVAAAKAGIDLDEWDPEKGFAPNAEIADKIYKYYGEMFASDPDKFIWAGMGSLVGPGFIAGMKVLPQMAEFISDPKMLAALEAAGALPPGLLPPGATTVGIAFTTEELHWYEVQFMKMQQDIFFDMAAKHEAFIDGGADRVEQMMAHEPPSDFKSNTLLAFRYMEEGVNLEEAAKLLVIREQNLTIGKGWDDMRGNMPFGPLMTYGMTLLGTPSIPGSSAYAEIFPVELEASLPIGVGPPPLFPGPYVSVEPSVVLQTPLPAGDISIYEDRMKLIEADSFPKYLELIRNNPDLAVELATGSALERSEQYAVDAGAVLDALTNWGLDFDVTVRAGIDWGPVDDIRSIVEGVGDVIGGAVGVGETVVDIGEVVIDTVSDAGGFVVGAAADAGGYVVDVAVDAGGYVVDVAADAGGAVVDAGGAVVDKAGDVAGGIKDGVVSIFD